MRDDDPFSNDTARVTWADWAVAMAEERVRVRRPKEMPIPLQVMVTFRCGGLDCSAMLPEGKTLH
jgi:hypothetical protein